MSSAARSRFTVSPETPCFCSCHRQDETCFDCQQGRHEPPLCESKNCPNRAVGLVTDRNGVQWAACEKHARDVLGDA